MRRQRGKQHDAAAFVQDRQQLLHQKEWRADIDREQAIEILDRGLLDHGRLGHAGIGDEDIEAVADDGADLPRQSVRAVACRKIGSDSIGAAAGLADFGDDGLRLLRSLAVMHEHLRAQFCQRQRAGTADAARGAGDEGGFSIEASHDYSPCSAYD
jgi:hypothetical protein